MTVFQTTVDPSAVAAPLLDQRGRALRDLRISVMDRCNFRCTYCMPAAVYGEHDLDGDSERANASTNPESRIPNPAFRFQRNDERLSFDEIERLCRLAAGLGVTKLRLTGGEPLLRPHLAELVARLHRIDGIVDLAMTTNGVLLTRHAAALRDAGLDRVTISLDTLDPALFHRMSGQRGALEDVLAGIEAAQAAGFPRGIKLNAVIRRGQNEHGVLDLVERFRGSGIVLRFIEYMDVGTRNDWTPVAVVPSRELIERIDARWPLEALPAHYHGEVASRFRFRDGAGEIGVIASISAPFCGDCTRARLSSEGTLYTCLFATGGTDLRGPLRDGASDETLRRMLRNVWQQRTDRYSEERGEQRQRARRKIEMHYIGG